jgi:hypothetical protein
MPGSNSLLLLNVMVTIFFVGSANSTIVSYQGHVYCFVATYGANGTSNMVELPVNNVDMKLMEEDGWFFPKIKFKICTF